MNVSYLIPQQSVRVYHEILRSKFISSLGHAPDSETARSFIQAVREEFADAHHNCWAYVAGPPGSSAQIGCSDDGEPRGTAGRPILRCLQHADVGEVVGVVTRYFGGTKLGRGGLIRAYSAGVSEGLARLECCLKVETVELRFAIGYAKLASFQHNLPRFEGVISRQEFGEKVVLQVSLPSSCELEFRNYLQNLTGGQVDIATEAKI